MKERVRTAIQAIAELVTANSVRRPPSDMDQVPDFDRERALTLD